MSTDNNRDETEEVKVSILGTGARTPVQIVTIIAGILVSLVAGFVSYLIVLPLERERDVVMLRDLEAQQIAMNDQIKNLRVRLDEFGSLETIDDKALAKRLTDMEKRIGTVSERTETLIETIDIKGPIEVLQLARLADNVNTVSKDVNRLRDNLALYRSDASSSIATIWTILTPIFVLLASVMFAIVQPFIKHRVR